MAAVDETTLTDPKEIMVRAAIRWTKIRNEQLQEACLIVLTEQAPMSVAARVVSRKGRKVTRQDVYRALKSVRPKLAEVQSYVEQQLEARP
jgi:hypothetical protein